MNFPMVSVVIPARNEERDIATCLEAVCAQDYPHDRLEVVVVDGGSRDQTISVARALLGEAGVAWTVIENSAGSTPSNLNAGLRAATGDVLCRIDARTVVSPMHVRRCVELLEDPSRVVVGGGQRAIARDRASVVARGIARALNNRWATGFATYRISDKPGPADTVYLGSFRVADLKQIGGWATDLPTNQDFDLNQRLGATGTVWFEPALTAGYLPRESLVQLAQQYFRFGRWKRRYWRMRSARPSPRQIVLLLLPPITAVAALWSIARRPLSTVVSIGSGLAVLDARGVEAPAAWNERAVAVAAVGTIASGWWAGVAWETIRG